MSGTFSLRHLENVRTLHSYTLPAQLSTTFCFSKFRVDDGLCFENEFSFENN